MFYSSPRLYKDLYRNLPTHEPFLTGFQELHGEVDSVQITACNETEIPQHKEKKKKNKAITEPRNCASCSWEEAG